MHPEFESQLGIYHERPPYERLLALSDCFGVNQAALS
jgi:hypothetical protein